VVDRPCPVRVGSSISVGLGPSIPGMAGLNSMPLSAALLVEGTALMADPIADETADCGVAPCRHITHHTTGSHRERRISCNTPSPGMIHAQHRVVRHNFIRRLHGKAVYLYCVAVMSPLHCKNRGAVGAARGHPQLQQPISCSWGHLHTTAKGVASIAVN